MGKILFIPFSVAGGYAAGFAGKKVFDLVWARIDDEEPPEAEHRDVPMGKLILALALKGGIFQITRGLAERGSRLSYARFTGRWPGEEEPDPAP